MGGGANGPESLQPALHHILCSARSTGKPRLERPEARMPTLDHEWPAEVHLRIINPDGTPTLGEDGKPVVIIQLAATAAR